MKRKMKGVVGIVLTVILLASLTVGLAGAPAGAASSNLKFTTLELPKVEAWDDEATFAASEGDYWATPGIDVGPIAQTPDGGTLFAAAYYLDETGTFYEVMKSLDGGYSWTVTGFYDEWTSGAIVDIVTSPEYADDTTVVVATEAEVYISDDGGKNFVNIPGIWSDATITDLDVTITEGGDLAIMVGTSGFATLEAPAGDTAEWSTDQALPAGGDYSVELSEDGSGDIVYVEVAPPSGITLADLVASSEDFGFSYYLMTSTYGPQLELKFGNPDAETGDPDFIDVTFMVQTTAINDEWVTVTCVETFGKVGFYDGTSSVELSPTLTDAMSDQAVIDLLDGLALADYELTRVRAQLWEAAGPRTCYIGDVTIAGTTYDLEPSDVYVKKGLLNWKAQAIPGSLPATNAVLASTFLPTFAADSDIGMSAVVTTCATTAMTFSFEDIRTGGGWGSSGIANAPFTNAKGYPFGSDAASIAFPDDFEAFGIGNNVCFVGISGADPELEGSDAYKVVCKEAGLSQAVDLDVRGVLTTLLPTVTDIVSIDVCGDAEAANIIVGTDACDLTDTPAQFLVYHSEDSGASWLLSFKQPTGGNEVFWAPNGAGLVFTDANIHVLMAPDFGDSSLAYAATAGGGTSAFQRTTDGASSWNQISLIDYNEYAVVDLDAAGYNADGTLHVTTQFSADSFSLTADAAGATATVTVDPGKVSVVAIAEATGTDITIIPPVPPENTPWTITLPDIGDAVLVTALADGTEVSWTVTPGTVTEAEVTDLDNDMAVGSSSVTMPDASNYGALWQRTASKNWERILSYATPGLTDTLERLDILGDGSAMFATDLNTGKIWRSTDMGATFPKTISTKTPLMTVAPVSATTLYTGNLGQIWWSTRSGTGWTKPDDSEIPSAAVIQVGVMGDVVLAGTVTGQVFISSDGGEIVERIGSDGPFAAGPTLVTSDLGFAGNGILYATAPGQPGVMRCVVDLDNPGDAEWVRIDEYQDSTGTKAYDEGNFAAGGPAIALPPSGVLYVIDGTAVATGDKAGGIWRCTNPTADTDSAVPPYFERENKGLAAPDAIGMKSLDLAPPALAPTFFCGNGAAANYYEQIVMFTDILNVGVALASPDDGAAGVGLIAAGYVKPAVNLAWKTMAGATKYQYQVAYDPDFASMVKSGYITSLVESFELSPNTTYYWRVRVANQATVGVGKIGSLIGAPLISPWSEAWKFKTAIGASMARPALQAPSAGGTGVALSPTFEWSGIEWSENYEFELSTDPATTAGGYFATPLVSLTGENAVVSTAWKCDIALDYGTDYYWQVKAIGVDTETPWSDVGTFVTMSKAPAPVTPGPALVIPPAEQITPAWIWAIVIIGAILVISVVVLIVTTRRTP